MFQYPISKTVVRTLKKYSWLNNQVDLRPIGTVDEREIIRLLNNPHYEHIEQLLSMIDKWGSQSGDTGLRLLQSKDPTEFSGILAELFLFVHFKDQSSCEISPINGLANIRHADFEGTIGEDQCIIEVYSPIDFYGYQLYLRYSMLAIKYASVDAGFWLEIKESANSTSLTYDFPNQQVLKAWTETFSQSFIDWIQNAENDASITIPGPNNLITIQITLKRKLYCPDDRSIYIGRFTISTDTKLFFERDWPNLYRSQWGNKLRDKMEKQQAGSPTAGTIRILMINFSMAESSDLSWLMDLRYHNNLKHLIESLSSTITPNPPYDLVVPCVLGRLCGFGHTINLGEVPDDIVQKICRDLSLTNEILEAPAESEVDMQQFEQMLLSSNDSENCLEKLRRLVNNMKWHVREGFCRIKNLIYLIVKINR